MIEPVLPPLSEWANFYVILGSAAAGLTGLQFVVIALGAGAGMPDTERAVRAFGTPTVMHFCAVLLVASILEMPGHTVRSVGVSVALVGVAGLGLSIRVVVQARRQQAYAMVLSDWVWHVALPLLAYASVVAAAIAVWPHPGLALHAVAGATLLLLFVGIHNAWDAAVWIVAHRQ